MGGGQFREVDSPRRRFCSSLIIKMMIPRNLEAFFVVAFLLASIFLRSASSAKEKCSAEAKLLLSPEQTQLAATALDAREETLGHVYLFDTDKLDLLSQGVIVRLRQGTRNDLMVKLRSPAGKEFFDPGEKGSKYKCEEDVAGGEARPSYSITTPYSGQQLPITGNAVFSLLTPAQKKLLQEAQVSIDWSRVRRIADIQSTEWQVTDQGDFHKLTLELWKWPAGQILELSTKTRAEPGPAAYSELRQLAKAKGLSLLATQQLKTAIVLQSITSK